MNSVGVASHKACCTIAGEVVVDSGVNTNTGFSFDHPCFDSSVLL